MMKMKIESQGKPDVDVGEEHFLSRTARPVRTSCLLRSAEGWQCPLLPGFRRYARWSGAKFLGVRNEPRETARVSFSPACAKSGRQGTTRSPVCHPATSCHPAKRPRHFVRDQEFPWDHYRVFCSCNQGVARRQSKPNSLAIGGVELPFAVPLSTLEVFEGGGIAGVLPESQETRRRLGPILGNQDDPDTPFRHIGRRLQQLDFSLLVKTPNDNGHGTTSASQTANSPQSRFLRLCTQMQPKGQAKGALQEARKSLLLGAETAPGAKVELRQWQNSMASRHARWCKRLNAIASVFPLISCFSSPRRS